MQQEDQPLATGGTSDVYAWQDGQVLKLFRRRSEYHPHEIEATRAAHGVGLPVPAVVQAELVEVDGREGIVFERVDGPTMSQYVNANPDALADCAHAMAALHAEIHKQAAPETLIDQRVVLAHAIGRVDALEPKAKETILHVMDVLPDGHRMCHGDFHPANIIMSTQGLVAIDWSHGTRGNSLADFAQSSLLAMAWPWFLAQRKLPELVQNRWREFWDIYLERYRALHPYSDDDLKGWQLVMAAALQVLGRKPAPHWFALIEDTLRSGVHL